MIAPKPQLLLPSGRRPITRYMRTLRAIWRDTSALLKEFRVPILALLIATVGGGWLYGELYLIARGERISMLDLPYDMIQLMTLQGIPEEKPPPEPYLVIFWYGMPLIGLYVIGRGAVDFGRLFFDRSGRRNAWEEAVASTYRNHIIVIGIGHVGLRIVRQLVAMGFEVVCIDGALSAEKDDELSHLHVPLVIGDGRLPAMMEKAGIQHARSLVICTSDDHVNLEITMRARDLNPKVRIVVRMWDATFARQLNRFMGVEAVLSASDLAAPAFAGAAVGIEVTQTVKVHGVDYSMIRMTVEPGSFMDGDTIGSLQQRHKLDIVLHARAGEAVVHPDGAIRVQTGDTLVLFAQHSRIIDLVAGKT